MIFRQTTNRHSLIFLLLPLFLLILVSRSNAQSILSELLFQNIKSDEDWLEKLPLKQKIVPLNNPVYQFLDLCEANGKIDFLPQAKPYSKIVILKMILDMSSHYLLTGYEKDLAKIYISDLSRATSAFKLHEEYTDNTYALLGFGAETSFRTATGDSGTYSTSLTGVPFFTGDLGENVSFFASLGGSFERLAPDLFYQSYTSNGKVNLPYDSHGYAYLPYQFNYETLYLHIVHNEHWDAVPNINQKLGVGMIYYTELNANLLEGAVQLSLNNQRRSWGHDPNNLVLSSTARRFPGFEFKVQPAAWLSYSLLTGSLFSPESQKSNNTNLYGYDTGLLENLFTLHLLEYTPTKWLQISATLSNIWWKRMELSYLMPFTFSHFSQLENGDFDNNAMSVDMAFRIPKVGKAWLSFFNDELSFNETENFFTKPRNRYAVQVGLKTGILSNYLPGTFSILKYTRVTPFAYTHYTENRFDPYGDRPLNMTYTHDGFNLGFYLPPNSAEYNLTFVNIAVPDLILTFDNKLIIHGTNDLSSDNIYQIYGDVNRNQFATILDYPLLDFTKDGMYDWTIINELKFDWKVRAGDDNVLDYFRVFGSVGFAGTWWAPNNTGISSPGSRTMLNFSLGVSIDI